MRNNRLKSFSAPRRLRHRGFQEMVQLVKRSRDNEKVIVTGVVAWELMLHTLRVLWNSSHYHYYSNDGDYVLIITVSVAISLWLSVLRVVDCGSRCVAQQRAWH